MRFLSWEIQQYFRVQFNARQSSISKLQFLSVTYISVGISQQKNGDAKKNIFAKEKQNQQKLHCFKKPKHQKYFETNKRMKSNQMAARFKAQH